MGQTYKLWSDWDRPLPKVALAWDEELESSSGQEWAVFLAEHLTRDGMSVLDAGAGTGFLSLLLSQQGHRVIAVEASPQAVAVARERFEAWSLPVVTERMDIHTLRFPDGSFDAVVSRSALWGLEDPAAACRELTRVLRPGGMLLIGEDTPHR